MFDVQLCYLNNSLYRNAKISIDKLVQMKMFNFLRKKFQLKLLGLKWTVLEKVKTSLKYF